MEYECMEEHQRNIDEHHYKSKCCNSYILANSLGEWFCSACGKELKENEVYVEIKKVCG